jgi:hypothetical protein
MLTDRIVGCEYKVTRTREKELRLLALHVRVFFFGMAG